MSVTTVEGFVKDGRVVIPSEFKLPEAARVYIIVPDDSPKRIMSPRLANKDDAKLFIKSVEDDIED